MLKDFRSLATPLWGDSIGVLENYVKYIGILGECLSISSLPCKILRSFVTSRGLPSNSTCVLKVEPGKLDIKRREPGILFISDPLFHSSNNRL